jgi:hypothetical protein
VGKSEVKASWKFGVGGDEGNKADHSAAVGAHQSSSEEGSGRETSDNGIEVGISRSICS